MTTAAESRNFPVVCVGGSAGGLQAFAALLQHLPVDLGIAVVIVNHMRNTATQLHRILPRYTSMPVELITERLVLKPNRVYIIPENRDLHVLEGTFRLEAISKPRGWPDVITVFFRSFARFWDGRLIAVIVSGYDCDGAAALCEIRDVGGITIAQTDASAKVRSMPREAVASGCIDLILSPEEMGPEIAHIVHSSATSTT